MADLELKEILTEYKNLAESEHHSFVSSLVNNNKFAITVFAALQIFEERPKATDHLPLLCDLLFNTYRRDPDWRYFTLQFLPHLVSLFLINYGEKQHFECLETWLIGVHNIETVNKPTDCFRIPSLHQNSVYHDANQIQESRATSGPLTEILGEKSNSNTFTTVERSPPAQVKTINSQNKLRVVSHLFSVYSRYLGDYDKQALEHACKVSSRMVTRGFSLNSKRSHKRNTSYGSDSGIRSPRLVPNRLSLSSPLLLEMLQLAYYALHNGCSNAGLTLAKDIESRGRRECLASVLLVSSAVLQVVPKASMVEEQRYITTPTQLSKNMITNASFRTKKLEGDIPRLDGEEGQPQQQQQQQQPNLDNSRMSAIAEDSEEKEEGRKGGKDLENIADKIKAKMENVRIPLRKKDRDRLQSECDIEKGKNVEKKEKRKERKEKKDTSVSDSDGGEEIRLQNLPAETIAIHSPESGSTSIF